MLVMEEPKLKDDSKISSLKASMELHILSVQLISLNMMSARLGSKHGSIACWNHNCTTRRWEVMMQESELQYANNILILRASYELPVLSDQSRPRTWYVLGLNRPRNMATLCAQTITVLLAQERRGLWSWKMAVMSQTPWLCRSIICSQSSQNLEHGSGWFEFEATDLKTNELIKQWLQNPSFLLL